MLRFTGPMQLDYAEPPPSTPILDRSTEVAGWSDRTAAANIAPTTNSFRPRSPNPIALKLAQFSLLEASDVQALDALLAFPKSLRAGQILVHENSVADHVYMMVRGMACRYKLLRGGERQILGYLIPGDVCDVHFVTLNKSDHSVVLLGDCEVVKMATYKFKTMLAEHPRIERALSLAALHDIAILREWLVNVGQRDALQKVSHFFCEMAYRLARVGQVDEDESFDLPINQMALADTTGLTPVHINRTLQRLRSDGLVKLCQRRLSIVDSDRLAAIAGFDTNYLKVRQCTR